MKIYILTSVALFAENGDLHSLDNPSICTKPFPSQKKAQKKMLEELETEKSESISNGYDEDDLSIEANENTASFLQGEPGSGCSWNQVTWKITEHDVPEAANNNV